tara:strand:- start:19977 stop:23111 length:3135 start_codon:yes stop_codon:yes gene_type:complete
MSLTWHATEANAKASSSAITTSTVYDKLYARLNFNDNDVRAVYIDWGDGDNRLRDEKANYQWKTFDNPVSGAIIEHTYTATGADYTPIIQTVNSEGFVSRYHMDGSNPDSLQLQPFTNNSSITGMAVTDGQATGILRVENKQVLSGIDNSIFEQGGPARIALQIPPLCTQDQLETIGAVTVEIQASMIIPTFETGTTYAKTQHQVLGGSRSIVTWEETLSAATVSGGTGITPIAVSGQIAEVLKVTWKNPKYSGSSRKDDYTVNESYKNFKIFLLAERVIYDSSYWYPVAYVTAGSPIKKANNSQSTINLDFSQSRAKASNVSNKLYRYDEGKVWFQNSVNKKNSWNAVTGSTGGVYEFFGDNTYLSGSSNKTVSYTYSNIRQDGLGGTGSIDSKQTQAYSDAGTAKWYFETSQKYRINQFLIDSFGRFNDQYRLTRCSVEPDSATNSIDTEVSSLTDNKPYVFRITPMVNWTGSSAKTTSPTKILDSGTNGSYSKDYTEAAFQNSSTNVVSLKGMNTSSFEDIDGQTREANEYLLLLFPKKTNKIFFNMNNYANNLIAANISGASYNGTWGIDSVSYLHIDNPNSFLQDAHWKALPFEDTTKVGLEYRDTTNKKYVEQYNSLSQSGYISFDMPLDWSTSNIKQLCGGVAIGSAYSVAGAYDVPISGTAIGSADDVADYGNNKPMTINTDSRDAITTSLKTTSATGATEEELIGSFRYAAIVTDDGGGAGDERMYWLASGGSNGYDNTTGAKPRVFLHYGTDSGADAAIDPTYSSTYKASLRRINIYEVLDGFSKVYGSATLSDNDLIPVGATASWNNMWLISGTGAGTIGKALVDAWGTTDLYALKVTLTGTAGTSSITNGEYLYPEIWNIFDATESHVQVVKEVDDSAYNLCSLGVTSDLSITRSGQYLTAVTKKGRVFIQKTGVGISSLSFSSIATGDTNSTTAFADQGPSSMYGRLHMIRRLQAEGVKVYWDEVQKDGTYVRFWGVIQNLSEVYATGGPTSIKSFTFNMTVTDVALIDANSKLMTDIFPLGGIEDESTYT